MKDRNPLPGEKPRQTVKRWMRDLPKYKPSELAKYKGEAERLAGRKHLTLKVEIPFAVLQRLNDEFEVASKFEMDRSLMKAFERLGKDFATLAKLVEKWG